MTFWKCFLLLCVTALSGACVQADAQTAPQTQPPASQAPAPDGQPAPPKGKVLFQSHGEPPAADSDRHPLTPFAEQPSPAKSSVPDIADEDRAALTATAYDLDARIAPESGHLSMRARITLRNDGAKPLPRISLQVSSTLHWDSAVLLAEDVPGGPAARHDTLSIAQHALDTDADHTGKANEAILNLPSPLGPGKSLTVDTFYSGEIAASGARLERIGATQKQALSSDWDAISSAGVALRGFGNVLWYPVSSPQLFLGNGAELFEAIGRTRLREEAARVHFRVAIEYRGDPPAAVYFCGRRAELKAISDDRDQPVATGSGVATAEFAPEALGFRSPDLFVMEHAETLIAPLPALGSTAPAESNAANGSSSSAPAASGPELQAPAAHASNGGPAMLAVETTDEGTLPALAASAQRVAPVLQEWFGARPLSALTILDRPAQPFEDGPLLVAPISSLAASNESPALAHSLTHAWIQSGAPWMDEGLAEFATLLWIEREAGREAAQSQLANLLQPLAPAEPSFDNQAALDAALASPRAPGQPLIAATDEIHYRRKAAAIWWMLRGITGDKPLKLALAAWATQPPSGSDARAQALGFEKLLEKTSGKDLSWFFHDWILNDPGLPDLSIVDVTPRPVPSGQGHDSGWLVAVTIRNDGEAAAEVPVIIRSGTFSTTHRMRIAAFSSATDRVITEAAPTEVVVNGGEVPEVRSSTHTMSVAVHQQ